MDSEGKKKKKWWDGEKAQSRRYRSGLARTAEAGPPPFCCISAFLTFTRGAHVCVEGVGMEMRAALHSRREETSPSCGSGKEPLVN